MAKTKLTKKQLMDTIQEKIQSLSLLQSVIQSDRSRKPESLDEFKKQFEDMLKAK